MISLPRASIFICTLSAVILVSSFQGCAGQRDDPRSHFGTSAPRYNGEERDQLFELNRRLDPKKKTYIVLQVDGGGIFGIIPARVLSAMEKALQKRTGCEEKAIGNFMSICSGTSTGAIISGTIAAGVPAEVISEFYLNEGVELFQKSGKYPVGAYPVFTYKFKRERFQSELFKVLEDYSTLRSATQTLDDLYSGPLLIIPAFDLRSSRTHFFRTREPEGGRLENNGNVLLADAISASGLSAPLVFGKVVAPQVEWEYLSADGGSGTRTGAVYNDGGQGTQNSTLQMVAMEALARGWGAPGSEEQVLILSLGTGNNYKPEDYENLEDVRGARQIGDFFGNQARGEATLLQWALVRRLCRTNPNYHLARFDWVNERSGNLDSFRISDCQVKRYVGAANNIIASRRFKELMDDLVRLKYIQAPSPQSSREKRQDSRVPSL